MNFKKLALATAIATMPLSAFALDEITDQALADVSGQDGLKAVLNAPSGITTSIYLHDTDGLGSAGFGAPFTGSSAYSFAGAIVVENMTMLGAGQSITIGVDAGDRVNTAGTPVLNVNIALPAVLSVITGSIRVANSQRDNANWSIDSLSSTILNTMTIVLNGTQLNIQLGNEAQTGTIAGSDMMVLNASVTGGISINSFRLSDATAAGDGGIGATSITMLDNGGANLTLGLDINADDTGLVVGLGRVGSATGVDVRIARTYLGSTSAGIVGDISIVGLNMNGATLTLSGK